MSILADESVDYGIIQSLRGFGFEVYSIAENNAGFSDIAVLKIANEKGYLLVTEDKDFGEYYIQPPKRMLIFID